MTAIDDLRHATAQLQALDDAEAAYAGNNPEKFRSARAEAIARIRALETELKRKGLIARTAQELLAERLDRAFPAARSRQVVRFEGRRYRRRFTPAAISRSGKSVTAWDAWWEPSSPRIRKVNKARRMATSLLPSHRELLAEDSELGPWTWPHAEQTYDSDDQAEAAAWAEPLSHVHAFTRRHLPHGKTSPMRKRLLPSEAFTFDDCPSVPGLALIPEPRLRRGSFSLGSSGYTA